MRDDQKKRLAELEEKLADQVISDINPEHWPGYGQTLAQMDKDTRGNALWARKIAAQGLLVFQKVQTLIIDPEAAAGKSRATDDDVDKLTAAAEREAEQLLKRVQQGSRKAHAGRTKH